MAKSRWIHSPNLILGVLLGLLGFAQGASAQADSTATSLRLIAAVGPAFAVGAARGEARAGYAVQASVLYLRAQAPWRLRADFVYQHMQAGRERMEWRTDGSFSASGDAVSSAAGAVLLSGVFAPGRSSRSTPYLLAGVGPAWPEAMTMANGGEHDGGTTRLAWQGGVGMEWRFGSRALSVETRFQSLGAARAGAAMRTVPVVLGVTF